MADISTTVTNWGDTIKNAGNEFTTKVGDFLPNAIGAFVVFIIGLILASSLKKLVTKVLSTKNIAKVVDNKKFHEGLQKAGVEWSVSDIISKFVYWVVIIITLMSVSNILGLSVLSDTLQKVVSYVPNALAAVIILAIAIAAGRFVKDLVTAGLTTLNLSFTKMIAAIVEGIIITFGVVTAFAQLGFETTIITANITVIVAGVVAMLAISLGLGTKDIVRSISVKHYAEKTFKKGETITIGDHTGKVKTISNLGIVLDTGKSSVFVPNNDLV